MTKHLVTHEALLKEKVLLTHSWEGISILICLFVNSIIEVYLTLWVSLGDGKVSLLQIRGVIGVQTVKTLLRLLE